MTLPYDPTVAVERLCRRDRRLARVIRRAGEFTLKPRRMTSAFESLLQAIVNQQLSGRAAATIYGRLRERLPRPARPTPDALLRLRETELRSCGLSAAKARAVRDLAEKTLDGTVPTLRKLHTMNDAEIVERLTAVRGVGVWTVEMLLIFRLGRPDVLPVGDLGIRHGFRLTYGTDELPKPSELLARGEGWRPYRSVASWYLWRAVDLHRAARPDAAR